MRTHLRFCDSTEHLDSGCEDLDNLPLALRLNDGALDANGRARPAALSQCLETLRFSALADYLHIIKARAIVNGGE